MIQKELSHFRSKLQEWFKRNKRALPWRKDPTWYKTYLSEIILQQTTVDQGLLYYYKFLKKYPDIKTLASASEQEILNMWAGLGYYSRGRNLLKSAQKIVTEYNATFPEEYNSAIQLPGIGPYSASAILSITYNKPLAVIDGNVTRVIARLFAIKKDIRNSNIQKNIKQYAQKLLDKNYPGNFNEALMELGSLVCTPAKPGCSHCPVNMFCLAYRKKIMAIIPYKSPARAKHKRFQLAAILEFNSKICIVRRNSTGLLAGMWELPAIEINKIEFGNNNIFKLNKTYQIKTELKYESLQWTHIYSHIHLTYKCVVLKVNNAAFDKNNYQEVKWIHTKDVNKYGIHNAHKKAINWYLDIS